MSSRHRYSHRDPSRHRVENKSMLGDFSKSCKGKEPEMARGHSPLRDPRDRSLSRSQRLWENWKAFSRDYSGEYRNSVYNGRDHSPLRDPHDPSLSRSQRLWENYKAFSRDYSDEYTNGVYTGPKDTSTLPPRPQSRGRTRVRDMPMPSYPSSSNANPFQPTHPVGRPMGQPRDNPFARLPLHRQNPGYTYGSGDYNVVNALHPSDLHRSRSQSAAPMPSRSRSRPATRGPIPSMGPFSGMPPMPSRSRSCDPIPNTGPFSSQPLSPGMPHMPGRSRSRPPMQPFRFGGPYPFGPPPFPPSTPHGSRGFESITYIRRRIRSRHVTYR
ncbi:hypothetical protein SEUCBS140593_008873 [Sporothrix eucalyptigena]|uniref:Uncharacterized protein n=1 Tax=Sporothrix eucalyptigena TaxID=1812306 RepID=A0ABP0CQ69_9PEZI